MWMSLQLAFVQINEMLLTGRFATMSPEVRQLMGQFGWTPASLRAMKLDKPLADDYAAGVGDGEHGKPCGGLKLSRLWGVAVAWACRYVLLLKCSSLL